MGVFLPVRGGIDLASTLDCGQAFRWLRAGDGWVGELAGRAAHVAEAPGGLWIEGGGDAHALMAAARVYFDAERDYAAIAEAYRDEPWIRRAFEAYPGLRVLRQPLFETIITFILSANNNAGRIRRISLALGEALGERLTWGEETNDDAGMDARSSGHIAYGAISGASASIDRMMDGHARSRHAASGATTAQPICTAAWVPPHDAPALYAFPAPQAIADAPEPLLRGLGMGYRAPYVRDASRMIVQGALPADMADLPYEDAHKALLALPGVGPKVADCILLFALGHIGAIPVDVWVERVLQRGFFPDVTGREALKRRAMERFGANAGIAQQVLFHAARNGTLPL